MSGKCELCGNDRQLEDGYVVCVVCGVVADHSLPLAADPTQQFNIRDKKLFSGQDVHTSMRNELSKCSVTPVRKMGIRLAETLASNFKFNEQMKSYLMHNYMNAINHKLFFNGSMKIKSILAAVCAYVTMINHSEWISMQHICSAIGCDCFDFGQIYNQFLTAFPNCKPSSKPIEEIVRSMLNNYDIEKEEINKLNKRVVDIISVVRECWLFDGRCPTHLINAATYFGWKSLKPFDRRKLNLKNVCEKLNIQYNLTTNDRVKELNDALIKLAKLIPSLKSSTFVVNKSNLAVFIDDITRFYNSLIYDHKFDVNKTRHFYHMNDNSDFRFMNSFKRRVNYDKLDKKRVKSEQTIDDCDDCPISDSEIICYLRTKDEIKMIKKLRKRANKNR